ncbi:MAG: hypothetical protein IJ714_05780, partial [Bacteroidales bacterium]|nr:hypothetical protein [Bacteroidales bacterium]
MEEIEYNPFGYPEVRLEPSLTIFEFVQKAGEVFGEKTFLQYEDRGGAICEVSFRQTADAAKSIALWLTEEYGPSHVALLGGNSFEYASVLLGTTGARSVAVPLDTKLPGP